MLEYIRSNAQSFGVKLVFGVIILVFVFWGVGSFSDKGGQLGGHSQRRTHYGAGF